jgi:hypothetical protein
LGLLSSSSTSLSRERISLQRLTMVDWGCEASGRASRFARDAFFFARAVDGEWAVQNVPRLVAVKSPHVTHLRSDGIAADDQSGSESSK